MKLSEKWLREWVNPKLTREELIHLLIMAGIGIESCELYENSKDDYVLEFELTPNRGDCLSILGIAREVSALTDTPLNSSASFEKEPVPHLLREGSLRSGRGIFKVNLQVQLPENCPRYVGRVISNFSKNHSTPEQIQLRLKQSGIKLIHPIVDVMNYVMLELGQPLHAFDLDTIGKEIIIRQAKPKEEITLLDSKKIELDKDVLVIADKKQVHAIAGIMGGLESSVTEKTQSIFIESAFFTPDAIMGRARRYGLFTDASHRFERGVDPELPRRAIERATELLSQIYADLEISEITEEFSEDHLPKLPEIILRPERVEKILGLKLSIDQIKNILLKLNMMIKSMTPEESIIIIPPSYRFDIKTEIDIIEEIARLYGYENLPIHHQLSSTKPIYKPENNFSLSDIKKALIYQGYQEIITYSFIAEKAQHQFDPENKPLKLENPLSSEYAVMRTNLWAGLLEIVLYNLNRQQENLRFFETGLRFVNNQQEEVLSGVWAGKALPEQWGEKNRPVDFFDLKNTLSQIFSLTREENAFTLEAGLHPALHPAQSANILKKDKLIGLCGSLHPALLTHLNIKIPILLFEIKLDAITQLHLPQYKAFSKFPTIRRDIALVVDNSIEVNLLKKIIETNTDHYLSDFCVFDVYQGKNLPTGKKSLALGLIFQAPDRTLVEEEIQTLMTKIIKILKSETGAALRE